MRSWEGSGAVVPEVGDFLLGGLRGALPIFTALGRRRLVESGWVGDKTRPA